MNTINTWPKQALLVLFIPLLLLTSCKKQINVNTYADKNSIPHGFPHGASFYIFTKPDDRSFLARETTNKLAYIIHDKGYRIGNKHTANYYLFFTLDMQTEKRIIQVPMKVTEQIVTKKSNVPQEEDLAHQMQLNKETISSQLVYVPEEKIFFNKSMVLQIFDAEEYRKSPQAEPLWQGEASTLDENNDLRDSIDYLLITAFSYMGKNTKKSLTVSINNNDKHVKKLRKWL